MCIFAQFFSERKDESGKWKVKSGEVKGER